MKSEGQVLGKRLSCCNIVKYSNTCIALLQISANLEITVTMADVVVRLRGISSPNKTTTTTPFLMQYLCFEMEKGKWRRKENLEVSITTIRDHEVSTSCDMP